MTLFNPSVNVVAALLVAVVAGASQAADFAGGPYRDLCRGANVDFSADAALLPREFVCSVQSTLPGVKPDDIRFTINAGDEHYDLPVSGDGTLKLPVSKNLFDSDARLVSNQPKGTLKISGTFDVRVQAISVPINEHLRDGRIAYSELVKVAIDARRAWIEKTKKAAGGLEWAGPDVGDPSLHWAIILQATEEIESAKVEIVKEPPTASVGPLRKGLRNLLGERSTVRKANPGKFLIPYSEELLKQNPMVSLSQNPTWEVAIGNVSKALE